MKLKKVKKFILKGNKLISINQVPLQNRGGVLYIKDAFDIVKDFINTDREDGVRQCTYFWQRNLQAVNALDTQDRVNETIQLYKSQEFYEYKTIPVSKERLAEMGVKFAEIVVFRNADTKINLYGMKPNGETVQDIVSIAFGYLPADCEQTLVRVEL